MKSASLSTNHFYAEPPKTKKEMQVRDSADRAEMINTMIQDLSLMKQYSSYGPPIAMPLSKSQYI